MINFLKIYSIAAFVFLTIDIVWLGVIAPKFYQRHIGHLLSPDVQWIAAACFYIIFLAGLVFFVIQPAIEKQSLNYALVSGAFFGLVCYATYDLTNMAVMNNWPIVVTVVDMAWGAFLCATVSIIVYLIGTKVL